MYLVMTKDKPTPLDDLEVRKVFNCYASSQYYEGEPTASIRKNLLKEEDDTLVISADSRLLQFVPAIVPIEQVYLYERGKPLKKLTDCTKRLLRPGHNLMRLFDSGEFHQLKEGVVMNEQEKRKANHQVKSNQVKKLKRKLKNKAKNMIPLELLQNILEREESNPIIASEYMYDYDDKPFLRDEATKEARILLLKELIETKMKKRK